MTQWGKTRTPFFFAWDFEGQKPFLCLLDELPAQEIWFDMEGVTIFSLPKKSSLAHLSLDQRETFERFDTASVPVKEALTSKALTKITPVSLKTYTKAFQHVQKNLQFGNSFLTNLTCRTPIESPYGLEDIFYAAKARFKLYFKDQFICFSPEPFVTITPKEIATFPMKGTIDANLPKAAQQLLKNSKEAAEHATVVDLLRNDLAQIADRVEVRKYRYLEEVQTTSGTLLQSSSEVVGQLKPDFWENLGENFLRLLPAGSISGAPKTKTCQIIREAEKEERGYFTGVFGYFDGEKLSSAVMIRFIEKDSQGNYAFRSGGGLTANSQLAEEYQEMIQKVYVPIY